MAQSQPFLVVFEPFCEGYKQVTSKPKRRHNNDQTDDYKHKMKR